MPDWFQNDQLFLQELKTGHQFATYAAQRIAEHGIPVDVTPMEVRADITDRSRFQDEHDLTVGGRQPCRIDVKSRALKFTGVEDYPYATAFVDTAAGWQAKQHKPHAIILVSQPTGALLVIPRSTEATWHSEQRYDHKRGIRDRFLMITRNRLRTFDELVAWLEQREQDPAAALAVAA